MPSISSPDQAASRHSIGSALSLHRFHSFQCGFPSLKTPSKEFMCQDSWERMQRVTHIDFSLGILGVGKGGPKGAIFGYKNSVHGVFVLGIARNRVPRRAGTPHILSHHRPEKPALRNLMNRKFRPTRERWTLMPP